MNNIINYMVHLSLLYQIEMQSLQQGNGKNFKKAMRTELKFNTAFRPLTDTWSINEDYSNPRRLAKIL